MGFVWLRVESSVRWEQSFVLRVESVALKVMSTVRRTEPAARMAQDGGRLKQTSLRRKQPKWIMVEAIVRQVQSILLTDEDV